MAKIVRSFTRIQDTDDVSFTPGSGVDGQVLYYDHATGKFTGDAGMVYDDANDELTLDGGLITGVVKPESDSATAIQIQDSGGTSILNVDTSNDRIGIGNTSPDEALEVTGYVKASSGLIAGVLKPASDGVNAVRLTTAGGTNTVVVDTTNRRLGLKGTPGATFDVWGTNGVTEMMFRNSNVDKYQVVRIGLDGNGSGLLDLYDKDQVHCMRLYAWDDRADTWFKSRYFGIGTSSPGEKLEVDGNVLADGYKGAFLRPETDGTTALQLQNDSGTSILNVDTTNSRVGIGNTAPNEALEVTGTVRADGLRLDITPTSETPTMTHTFTISLNGTDYKIPVVAA